MSRILKLCSGAFIICLSIVHVWFSFGCIVIFGLMEGWISHAAGVENVWLSGGVLISNFLLVSGILVFYEKKQYALIVCGADIIYWLVPCIASVVRVNELDGLGSFFRDAFSFPFAFCAADVIGIASMLFYTVIKNKQESSIVLPDKQEERK